jgi:hypothetical protein
VRGRRGRGPHRDDPAARREGRRDKAGGPPPGCPAGQQVQPAAHLERPGGLRVLVLHEDGRAGHRVDTLAGMFDVTRLRVLAAVARYGSITAVADSPL